MVIKMVKRKQVIEIIWVCEYCGFGFHNKTLAEECEKEHIERGET